MTRWSAAAILLGSLLSAALAAGEPLWKYAPGSTGIVFHVNAEAIRKTPFYQKIYASPEAKKVMKQEQRFKPEDLATLLCASDSEGEKASWIAEFSNASVLPAVMRNFQNNLTKLPEKPLQYRIKCDFILLDELRFVPWDGSVIGIYPRRGEIDRKGVSPKVIALAAKLPKDALAFGVGVTRFENQPFDAMKEFAVVIRPKGDKLILQGFVDCGEPLNAAFFGTSIMAMISMWLQNVAGLTPDEASAEIAKYRIRQSGSRLTMTIDDLELLVRSTLTVIATADKIGEKLQEVR